MEEKLDLNTALVYDKESMRWVPNKCANPNCEKPALILYDGAFVCGTCCRKLAQLKQEKHMEVLKNLK